MKKTILAVSLSLCLSPVWAQNTHLLKNSSKIVDQSLVDQNNSNGSSFFASSATNLKASFLKDGSLKDGSLEDNSLESNPPQNQTPHSRQSHSNGTFEQVWTAKEIKQLETARDKNSLTDQSLTDMERTVLQDLEEFNNHFSDENLRGYTSRPANQLPFDASMDTYYVDEDNNIVALYDDNANANQLMIGWAQSQSNAYPLTTWEQDILPQSAMHEEWVAMKIKDTSQSLHAKLQEARSNGQPYLLWVNVPSFSLRMYDTRTEELVAQSRVIVGASGTQTPIFTTSIVNLKFNPDWSPPPSLKRKGKRYTPPSDNNPLGQVRFSTNNNMNIYLHDTNNHQLFEQDIRALSAGCVRVENWHEIARYLGGMSSQEVDEHTAGHRTHFVDVPDSMVWISYERVDMDEQGTLKLFGDIYRKQKLPQNNLPRAIP